MFEECVTVNDYISRIFEIGLKQSYSKTIDNSEVNGYYLGVKSCPNSKVKDLDQWRRLFINLKSKTKKIYGSTDNENDFANNMAWAYECLLEILSGENDSFPIESDINTLLLTRGNEICSYVLRYVDLKQKTFINSKQNPNYIIHQSKNKKEYEKINFYYLDDDTNLDRYSVLETEEVIPEVGEVTEVLLETLLNSDILTDLERYFLELSLSDETYTTGGNIYDFNNELIMNKDRTCYYRRGIRNKIHKLIEEGKVIGIKNDRIVLLE